MLHYSASDAALLVALDRLQSRLEGVVPDSRGYCELRGRWIKAMAELAPALADRGWAHVSCHKGYMRMRVTRVGENELAVFRSQTAEAAQRARERGA